MNPSGVTTIGFDADDTLWLHEHYYKITEQRFEELLNGHVDTTGLPERLLEAEKRNLKHYGFGVKGFTLSMIETAVELSDDKVPAAVIHEILDLGRDMLAHPIDLLPHVQETLETLAPHYEIVLITKGDLFDQERKLASSGLGELFDGVEIVSDKTPEVYARAFAEYGQGPERAVMVGNSMKSDVVAAIAAGAHGVHVPHEHAWAFEAADDPKNEARFHRIEHLGALPALLAQL